MMLCGTETNNTRRDNVIIDKQTIHNDRRNTEINMGITGTVIIFLRSGCYFCIPMSIGYVTLYNQVKESLVDQYSTTFTFKTTKTKQDTEQQD